MTGTHSAFEALGPVTWDHVAQQDLKAFLTDTFGEAQCLVDSIPASLSAAEQEKGRPRSATNSRLPSLPNRTRNSSDRVEKLRKEWKEVKVNSKENPLGVHVYKLSAKDGKGAWFARRSVHEGLTFEKWKLGMQREFAESMKVQGKPGDGNIRGIGADKRVVDQTVDGCGKMEVYQLSAQFPGPTTPRDFVTLFLSSDSAIASPTQDGQGQPRYFMVVSKPCVHSECPQRQGFIRGQYESVEFIREIKVEKPLRKVRSSVNLSNEEEAAAANNVGDDIGQEAAIRSAHQAAVTGSPNKGGEGRRRGNTISHAGTENREEAVEDCDTKIEWAMVTRSDPGGSVPRFMIERGTPGGIAGDANKFLKWVSSKSLGDFTESGHDDTKLKREATHAEAEAAEKNVPAADPTSNVINDPSTKRRSSSAQEQEEEVEAPGGFYGMIAGALGAAASAAAEAAASRLPVAFGSVLGGDTESGLSTELSDDSSSIHSFHSLEGAEDDISSAKPSDSDHRTPSPTNGGGTTGSTHSSEFTTAQSTSSPSQHEKDLRKVENRKRKMEEKLQRAQERARSKHGGDSQRDETAVQKLHEKHVRDIAKQEAKYQRNMQKLEAKRAHDEKKAEQRRRKQAEREEKNNLSMELEKAHAERDLARKQIDILKEQVGELQSQNTMLVARLGREGISVDGGLSDGSSTKSAFGGPKRVNTEPVNGVKA